MARLAQPNDRPRKAKTRSEPVCRICGKNPVPRHEMTVDGAICDPCQRATSTTPQRNAQEAR